METMRVHGNSGENNGHAKLTVDQVRTIRAAYAAGGVTYRQLAKRYQVSGTTIAMIVQYGMWRSV